MNSNALRIMREALEKIAAVHQPTDTPTEQYDLEKTVEKLDCAVTTAHQALLQASIPDETNN